MDHHLKRQKEIYDKKAHGHLYNKGDKVWLFNAAVPKGTSRKFHKIWSGENYMAVKQISDIAYRMQHAHHPRKRMVVHFNHLKLFDGDVQEISKRNGPPVHSSEPSSIRFTKFTHFETIQ